MNQNQKRNPTSREKHKNTKNLFLQRRNKSSQVVQPKLWKIMKAKKVDLTMKKVDRMTKVTNKVELMRNKVDLTTNKVDLVTNLSMRKLTSKSKMTKPKLVKGKAPLALPVTVLAFTKVVEVVVEAVVEAVGVSEEVHEGDSKVEAHEVDSKEAHEVDSKVVHEVEVHEVDSEVAHEVEGVQVVQGVISVERKDTLHVNVRKVVGVDEAEERLEDDMRHRFVNQPRFAVL